MKTELVIIITSLKQYLSMNKIFSLTFLSLLLISVLGCRRELLLSRTESDNDIILRMNKEHEVVTTIQFPFHVRIENPTLRKKYFCDIQYICNLNDKSTGITLYKNLEAISFNGLKEVPARSFINYSAYSAHFVYLSALAQEQLEPYIHQMLELNKDTLHIGNIAQFRRNHGILLDEITKYDSISIRALKSSKSWDGSRIIIPANW